MVDLNVLIGERLSDEQAAEIVRMADIDGDSCINYYGWDKNTLPRKPSLMMFDSIEFVKVIASPDRKHVPDNHHRMLDDEARIVMDGGGYGINVLVYHLGISNLTCGGND